MLTTTINEAGIYRDYCYDIKVCNLCLNAIKQCDFLQENLTGSIVNAEDGCGKAFEVLRVMITRLLQDVANQHDRIANYQLMGIERWLLNTKSLLYHPMILKVVYRLMRLTFNAVSAMNE